MSAFDGLAAVITGGASGTNLAVDGGMHELRSRPSTGREQP
jgi:hypothetical protein